MNTKNDAPLTRQALAVLGPEATQFLQGMVTCDVEKATQEPASWGAHCTPQGRVVALFELQAVTDGYYLLTLANTLSLLQQSLAKYAAFSKVELSIANCVVDTDPHWHAALVEQGIAQVYPETSEIFTPHDLNYPTIGAVSFSKGCYVGQEIVARMQHRGTLKKHLQQIVLHTDQLKPGDKLYHEDKVVGQIADFTATDSGLLSLAVLVDSAANLTQLGIHSPDNLINVNWLTTS